MIEARFTEGQPGAFDERTDRLKLLKTLDEL